MGKYLFPERGGKEWNRRFQLGMDFLEQWCSEMLQEDTGE